MVHDSPERPMPPQKTGRGAKSDLPQDDLTKADLTLDTSDVDPESSAAEEDDGEL